MRWASRKKASAGLCQRREVRLCSYPLFFPLRSGYMFTPLPTNKRVHDLDQELQRKRRRTDCHEAVRNPQFGSPGAVGNTPVRESFMEELPGIPSQKRAKHQRQGIADKVAPLVGARGEYMLQHFDGHVTALQLGIAGAHESGND